jgi:hypothetical protein
LRPVHFLEGDVKRAGVLGVMEACTGFGFSCGRKDVAHDAADDMNGSIKFGRRSIGGSGRKRTEEENARDLALDLER